MSNPLLQGFDLRGLSLPNRVVTGADDEGSCRQ